MKAALVLCALALAMGVCHGQSKEEWWHKMSLYQIYPRSYKDSNGDGIGDLKGITSRLWHLAESNIDAFWLSPIYPSPQVDFGYDISNFVDIDPNYGTLKDFEDLVKVAHAMSVKVVMDLVPNHSSDKHEWFQKSLKNIEPYNNYYMWHKGRVLENGTIAVPNNWVSVFGGPAWTWSEERQAYYLHQFAREQPDLNYNNEDVVREMQNVMRFWLNKGVDGFRVDAVPHLCEDPRMLDEPLSGMTDDPDNYGYTEKVFTKDQPRTYEIVRGWRNVLDEFSKDGESRIMMIEAYANISMTMKYYDSGAHYPFNFGLITDVGKDSKAADFKTVIDRWMSNMPEGAIANWVAGNHDNTRLVTRFGLRRAQAITAMTLLLPGIGVTYSGEEIGMENTWISWEDSMDPQGCNAGKDGYEAASRDPVRSPFQWDDSTSAGFSTNKKTWLPVNENYKTLNLEAEKYEKDSYYTFYRALSKLKKSPAIKDGNLVTKLMNEDNILAFSRETKEQGSVYVLVNFADKNEEVDLSVFENVPKELKLHYSTDSTLSPGSVPNISKLLVPAMGTLIYIDTPQMQ